MGVTIGSTVYQSVLDSSLWKRLANIDNAADIIQSIKDSLDEVDQLPEDLQGVVRGSYMTALRAAFSTTVGFAVIALVTGLLVKEYKLHSTLTRDEGAVVVKGEGPEVSADD